MSVQIRACHCFKLTNNFPLPRIKTLHHCPEGPAETDSWLPLLTHLSHCEEQAAGGSMDVTPKDIIWH